MRITLLMLILSAASFPLIAQENNGIGYPTVKAALENLNSRNDVKISTQNGWTIIEDHSTSTFWSFTPPTSPAYPAAIKRTIVQVKGTFGIQMTALCQASKIACDKLIEEFDALNKRISQPKISKAVTEQRSPSEIEIVKLDDGLFRLKLKSFRSNNVRAGQEELLSKAKEVCGEKSFEFRKNEFESSEAVNTTAIQQPPFILKQDIECGASINTQLSTESINNNSDQWKPKAEQVKSVESQTYAYFAAKDQRKYSDAYGQLSPNQKKLLSFERWSSVAESFNAKAGEVRQRNIKKITWYKNPPQVEPGIYAAVDFSSQFTNANIGCGYVVWIEQTDGTFLLTREEEYIIDDVSAQKMKKVELEKVRAQFGCNS